MSSLRTEGLVGVTCLLIFGTLLRHLLFVGDGVLPHDNLYWCYPVFHFFAENLVRGHFVTWNPFVHGGEPFYPLIAQLRLWDPISIAIILIVGLFTRDTVIWFNWWHIIQCLIMAFGIYLLYRPLIHRAAARVLLIPILFFSSIILISFPQNAMLLGMMWIPYQAYLALRLINRRGDSWGNWLLLAVVVGINSQSYFFVPSFVFLFLACLAHLLFRRSDLTRLLRHDRIAAKITSFVAVVAVLALPNYALLRTATNYVFPLRMAPPNYEDLPPNGAPVPIEGGAQFLSFGGKLPYQFVVYSGGGAQLWDYLQLVAPDGNWIVHGDEARTWGAPSESYLYLGCLTWFVGLYGIFFGRHRRRSPMLFLLGVLILITLGPHGGAHYFFYAIFPPLWFIRNTGILAPLVQMVFLYFVCLGINRILPREVAHRAPE